MNAIEPVYAALGRKIHATRTGRRPKLTQEEVADRIGLPRSAISAIESGRQRVLTHTLLQLCEVFDVEPNDLLLDLDTFSDANIQSDEDVTEKDIQAVKNLFEVAAKS
jgi:transcriptional regulator with XRE-family HTH domain